MLLALTGEKLTGKGTAAAYLQEHYQATVLRCSQVLTDILQQLKLDNSRAHLVLLGDHLRQAFGDGILAQGLHSLIAASHSPLIVIDGLRYIAEWNSFKTLPQAHLIAITAPLELRFQRMQQRTEKSDEANMTITEFQAREHDATEREISLLKQQAELMIENSGSYDQLYMQLDQVMSQLNVSKITA